MPAKPRLKNLEPPVVKARPSPDIVAGGEWEIHDAPITKSGHTNSCCSRGTHKMWVPLGDSDEEFAIRMHEMGHVKWSPDTPPTVGSMSQTTMLACEDARINSLLNDNMRPEWNPHHYSGPNLDKEMKHLLDNDRLLEAACLHMAGYGTAAGATTVATLDRYRKNRSNATQVANAVLWAQRFINEDKYSFNSTLKAATYLEEVFRYKPPEKDEPGEGSGESDALMEKVMEGIERLMPRMERSRPTSPHDAGIRAIRAMEGPKPEEPAEGDGDEESGSEDCDWGEMVIETPPRPEDVLRKQVGRRSKQVLRSGTKLNKPHRVLSDGRVWKKRARYKGCSVLLDQSGSMGNVYSHIGNLVKTCPATIMAGYAGFDARPTGTDIGGYLRIHLKDGKCVTEEDMVIPHGGNGVDKPALEWLAKQPEPRIWISDGSVIPSGGYDTGDPRKECAEVCRKARIIRLDNIEEALEFLKRLI